MHEGTITKVFPERGFGFIAISGEPDLFFHAKDTDHALSFDQTLLERRVRFNIAMSPKGPQATGVVAA